MTPLRIRAGLVRGFAAKDPWSPAIDGIIAAVVMRDRIGSEEFVLRGSRNSTLEHVTGLPIEIVRDGDRWWYASSSPLIVDIAGRERRYFHRRFDDQHERHLVDVVKRVMTAAGPYKSTRLFDTRVIASAVEWHVIGDQTEIERILRRVSQIGGRRGIGYGEVSEWSVTADGDASIARHHRPLPVTYAEAHGIDGQRMPWGLVPPGRLDPVDCVMPEARHA